MLNSTVGFTLGTLIIAGMTITQFYIMQKTMRTKVNMVEMISLRVAFSIYTGWVMAATIINIAFFLKAVGMKDPNAGWNEDVWAVIIIYVALAIYILSSFMERNPVFGAVYIWVNFAIRKEATSSIIELHSLIAAIVSIVAMTGIFVYSLAEKMKFNKSIDKGLFY